MENYDDEYDDDDENDEDENAEEDGDNDKTDTGLSGLDALPAFSPSNSSVLLSLIAGKPSSVSNSGKRTMIARR